MAATSHSVFKMATMSRDLHIKYLKMADSEPLVCVTLLS